MAICESQIERKAKAKGALSSQIAIPEAQAFLNFSPIWTQRRRTMYIKGEEVRGVCIEEEDYCLDCINQPGLTSLDDLIKDQIITDVPEDDFRFCDQCGKRI